MIESPKESVRTLLAEIIDYAGLFPPSQITMQEAVINFATYRNSNYSWMLGRFVLPVARLDEFMEAAEDLISFAQVRVCAPMQSRRHGSQTRNDLTCNEVFT